MKIGSTLLLTVALATLVACSTGDDDVWFDGDLDAAADRAAQLDTLVFVEFYTEWCSWCRRLERETFTDREVKSELDQLVTVRLDAEGNGVEEAREFDVDSYPTMVFLGPDGEELERIVGYLPPDKLAAEIRRIRAGDTFFACLQELERNPANADAIRRAVSGLLERADPEGAVAKIRMFHGAAGHDHEVCRRLMFEAGRDLHYRVYLRAAKLYREGWTTTLEVPPIPGSEQLSKLLSDNLLELEVGQQAERLRTARYDDAAKLLELVEPDSAPDQDLYELAVFAFRGGHYTMAADLYSRWFESPEVTRDADSLNRAAWQLYLARQSLETGLAMATKAYELEPSADVSDTLARLLYVSGDRDRAITLQKEAARKASGNRTEQFTDVADQMERGLELDDRPAFENFPGPREIAL